MSQLFVSGGQSIGTSASASVLPVNFQYWFPLGLTGLISLLSKGLSRVFSSASVFSAQPCVTALTSTHDCWKTVALIIWTFVDKVMSLLFNTWSRSVIAFLPRSKRLKISWLQSPSTVILEPKKIKSLLLLFSVLFAMKWWDRMPLS